MDGPLPFNALLSILRPSLCLRVAFTLPSRQRVSRHRVIVSSRQCHPVKKFSHNNDVAIWIKVSSKPIPLFSFSSQQLTCIEFICLCLCEWAVGVLFMFQSESRNSIIRTVCSYWLGRNSLTHIHWVELLFHEIELDLNF